jgi:pyridoxine/pyridoxamine 5'-phosphate oxidase
MSACPRQFRARLTAANVRAVQFDAWFSEASKRGLIPREGMPMTLATATADGFPSARVSGDGDESLSRDRG